MSNGGLIMSANQETNIKVKDKLKDIIWTLILYLVFMIYWVVFLLIISFILNSIITIEIKEILIISCIFSTVMILIRIFKMVQGNKN